MQGIKSIVSEYVFHFRLVSPYLPMVCLNIILFERVNDRSMQAVTIKMSNCQLCEIDFSTDDIVVLQEHFVPAHSVDAGTAKILVNLPQRIERLESRSEPNRDPLLN
jgi:hypothetical protein